MFVPTDPAAALSFASAEDDGATTWTWDVVTGTVTWSAGIDALFGLPAGGFGGTYEAYLALVHPDDRAHFQALIARTLDGEDEYIMSHRVLWPDGGTHWIAGRGRLTRDENHRPLKLDGIVWDENAKKRAHARITHLQRVRAVAFAVSRGLLRVRNDGEAFEHACRIAVEDGHFQFAWVGLVAGDGSRVTPVARAGVDDRYLEEITVAGDLHAGGRGPVGQAIRDGRAVVVNDFENDSAFDPWREAAMKRGYRGCASLPLSRGGRVIGVLLIYAGEVDRFDAPQLELLQSLSDDIGFALEAIDEGARRRAAELDRNRAQDQLILADRLSSLGRLAAGVAHEVNNPLAYLALNLERIERALDLATGATRATDETSRALADARAAATEAMGGAERVRGVVRALGAFGRDDEERIGAVDLHRVLDTAVRLAENHARHRGHIVKEYGATRGVRGDELRLGQVFVNLLVNAADALEDGAADRNEVHVKTFDDGEHVIVEVSDNGAGIAPELLGSIFDPFFTTKAVGEGTGLGLSISYSILKSFGGTIGVESAPGEGSVFRVTLVSSDRPPTLSAAKAVVVASTRRARILVVDDEPMLAKLVAESLEPHQVSVETDGRAALDLCLKTDYDCILCDLMMPGLSGVDLHAELARAKPTLCPRMVFMTGGVFTSRGRDFVASVGNTVLEKPFTIEQMTRAIERVLDDTDAKR